MHVVARQGDQVVDAKGDEGEHDEEHDDDDGDDVVLLHFGGFSLGVFVGGGGGGGVVGVSVNSHQKGVVGRSSLGLVLRPSREGAASSSVVACGVDRDVLGVVSGKINSALFKAVHDRTEAAIDPACRFWRFSQVCPKSDDECV